MTEEMMIQLDFLRSRLHALMNTPEIIETKRLVESIESKCDHTYPDGKYAVGNVGMRDGQQCVICGKWFPG